VTTADGSPPPTGIVLFDPSGTAHAGPALDGLARAAAARGLPVVVHAPVRPDAPGDLTWVEVDVGTMLPDRSSKRAHRRALVDALRAAPAGSVFCDLGLGRTMRSRGPRIPAAPSTVCIGHQTNAINARRDGGRRRDGRGNQRVLEGLGRSGARFVAHTDAAADRLAQFVPAAHIHRLGWPVVARDDPCLLAPVPEAGPVTLLFAGSARVEKGLPLLTRAIRGVEGFERLVVPGRVAPFARAQLDLSDSRIDLWDRWLEQDEYFSTLAGASIVVLPYQAGYLRHGVYSSVMGEAMARGRPLVVSGALGHLLPDGYRGAVVAEDESEEALAAALRSAIQCRGDLEAAAMADGRAYVREHHSYEGYLDGILRAGTGARPAGAPVRSKP
jgi:glycosyltransferase involved in cell wall biosynthesis